jgi:hypothetical protein
MPSGYELYVRHEVRLRIGALKSRARVEIMRFLESLPSHPFPEKRLPWLSRRHQDTEMHENAIGTIGETRSFGTSARARELFLLGKR